MNNNPQIANALQPAAPLLFRCSSAGALLTDPKLKSDKEAGNLSETAKTLITNMWLERKYGYRELVVTEPMTKGTQLESDSLELVDLVIPGIFRAKNRQRFQNEYIIGTPDTKAGTAVEDIKTCWTLRTFHEAEPSKMNITQIQCYMALMGLFTGRVIFTLLPTSEDAILRTQDSLKWKYGGDTSNEDYIKHCEQIKRNNDCIMGIPPVDRVKVFEYQYSEEMIETLYGRILKAREYYNTLKLTPAKVG